MQDGRIEGCSDGDSIPDPFDLPNRVAIFMAGTQPVLHSSTAAAMISGSTAAIAAGAGGPVRPPGQVLSELFDALVVLIAEVSGLKRDLERSEEELGLTKRQLEENKGK